MPVFEAAPPSLRVVFGPAAAQGFPVGLPVLAGDPVFLLPPALRPAGRLGGLELFSTDDWLIGAAAVAAGEELEAATLALYREILGATRELHLARIWNYVPAINAPGPGGLENYRLFSRGRSLAFEQQHGAAFKTRLPAASAVGCAGDTLTVIFAATRAVPRHVESPLQVPAYNYPGDYGPRAPSFARATIVEGAAVFISGTAAIRGHATVAPNDTGAQLACTLENLRAISDACGLGPALGAGGPWRRDFKIYVRHASETPAIAAALEERLLLPGDSASYLHADICRAALNLEIEVTLWPA